MSRETLIPGRIMYPLHSVEADGRAGNQSGLYFDFVTYLVFRNPEDDKPLEGQVIPAKHTHHYAQIEFFDGKDSGVYCVPHDTKSLLTQSHKVPRNNKS